MVTRAMWPSVGMIQLKYQSAAASLAFGEYSVSLDALRLRPTKLTTDANMNSSENAFDSQILRTKIMKHTNILMLASVALLTLSSAQAQVAGSTLLGVAAAELREVAAGWSAKKQVLGQAVYNGKGERIGAIDDVVIAPDKAVSYVIIGAGGFLGVDRHDVAIPVNQLKLVNGKFVLADATKDAIKQMPQFEYGSR